MNVETTALSPLQRAIAAIRQQHWLSLTLLALHGALTLELSDPLARALLLSHFGFFLLWQPLWRGGQKLFPGQVGLIIAAAVFLIAAASWWMMALWISVLFSLIGGNVPGIKNFRQRIVSLLAAIYLLSVLLTWVVPHLFPDQVFPETFQALVRYGLVIPVVAIFFVRTEKSQTASEYSVDLFYSLLLFLLVVVLVLGAFVIKQVSHGNYVISLAQALIVAAGLLVALSLLWDPRAGFAGIGQLVSRYFLSVGVPFERWMHSLAALADRERDPDKFVIVAAHEMAGLPWLSGIAWQSKNTTGNAGEITKYPTEFTLGGLTLKLYTPWSPSPALVLHIRLLARLLADYYDAKMREQEQRRNAYVQAIYETGSRLTHDVKNLLQTLRSLVCGGGDQRRERFRSIAAVDAAAAAADHAASANHPRQTQYQASGRAGQDVRQDLVAGLAAALCPRAHRVRWRRVARRRNLACRPLRFGCREFFAERTGKAKARNQSAHSGQAAVERWIRVVRMR